MSKDGYLPDGVRESDLPGSEDHHLACPCHEDQPERCECGCDMEGHPKDRCDSDSGRLGLCGCDGRRLATPNCECFEIAEDIESARAEASYERLRAARDE